jgi:hypothetical protein
MKTRVVHCRKEKYDTYIGRPSKWGNPHRLKEGESRDDCIAKYRDWLMAQPNLLAALGELKGKVLGCWCKPQKCHGDVLAELADAARVKPNKKRARKRSAKVAARGGRRQSRRGALANCAR